MQYPTTSRVRQVKKKPRRGRKRTAFLGMAVLAFMAVLLVIVLSGSWERWTGASGSSDGPAPVNEVNPPVAYDEEADSTDSADSTEPDPPDGDNPSEPETGSTGNAGESEAADTAAAEPEEANIQLLFTGDILLGSTVEMWLEERGYDDPYKQVKALLQKPDLTIGNLETPITERGTAADKAYAYRSSPKALPALAMAGVDVVSLANNHMLDYGTVGMLDTLNHLQEAGIQSAGAGQDADAAFKPAIMEKNGIRVAFLSFSRVVPEVSWKAGFNHPGVADTYAAERPLKAIRQAKENADLVVVLPHWGDEREDLPNDNQRKLARKYIDAGADLIVGNHPHVLQSLERYKGKWIIYSLGNFVFTTNASHPKTWDTALLEANCSQKGDCGIRLEPLTNKWGQPKPLKDKARETLLGRLTELSEGIEIDSLGYVRPSM